MKVYFLTIRLKHIRGQINRIIINSNYLFKFYKYNKINRFYAGQYGKYIKLTAFAIVGTDGTFKYKITNGTNDSKKILLLINISPKVWTFQYFFAEMIKNLKDKYHYVIYYLII